MKNIVFIKATIIALVVNFIAPLLGEPVVLKTEVQAYQTVPWVPWRKVREALIGNNKERYLNLFKEDLNPSSVMYEVQFANTTESSDPNGSTFNWAGGAIPRVMFRYNKNFTANQFPAILPAELIEKLEKGDITIEHTGYTVVVGLTEKSKKMLTEERAAWFWPTKIATGLLGLAAMWTVYQKWMGNEMLPSVSSVVKKINEYTSLVFSRFFKPTNF